MELGFIEQGRDGTFCWFWKTKFFIVSNEKIPRHGLHPMQSSTYANLESLFLN